MNLLTIAKLNDGTFARQLLAYATRDEALTALYMSIASGISNTSVMEYTAELISDNGHVAKCERWAREVEENTITDPTENSAQLG